MLILDLTLARVHLEVDLNQVVSHEGFSVLLDLSGG